MTKRLAAAGKSRGRVNAARPPAPPPPSPKRLSFDWVRRREARDAEQVARLEAIRGRSAELAAALDLGDEFAALIRKQSSDALSDWLTRAEGSSCPELRRFAEGIRRDEAAVRGAVTEPWSNGQVEGQVNRLKIVATDYPDCHSPSLTGYTTGRAVDGVPRAGRLGPPTPAGRTGRIPMPRPHNTQRPPAR